MKDLSHILKECSIKDIYYGNSAQLPPIRFLSTSVIMLGSEMKFLH